MKNLKSSLAVESFILCDTDDDGDDDDDGSEENDDDRLHRQSKWDKSKKVPDKTISVLGREIKRR